MCMCEREEQAERYCNERGERNKASRKENIALSSYTAFHGDFFDVRHLSEKHFFRTGATSNIKF